jgi:hypothetical protein
MLCFLFTGTVLVNVMCFVKRHVACLDLSRISPQDLGVGYAAWYMT